MEPAIRLEFELAPAEALALAQFLKRVGLDDYRRLAVDADEAWTMLDAGERVRAALIPPLPTEPISSRLLLDRQRMAACYTASAFRPP